MNAHDPANSLTNIINNNTSIILLDGDILCRLLFERCNNINSSSSSSKKKSNRSNEDKRYRRVYAKLLKKLKDPQHSFLVSSNLFSGQWTPEKWLKEDLGSDDEDDGDENDIDAESLENDGEKEKEKGKEKEKEKTKTSTEAKKGGFGSWLLIVLVAVALSTHINNYLHRPACQT